MSEKKRKQKGKERKGKEKNTKTCHADFLNLSTDLGVPFCKFLEHVSIGLFVLFVMFLNLALTNGNLSTSCSIC